MANSGLSLIGNFVDWLAAMPSWVLWLLLAIAIVMLLFVMLILLVLLWNGAGKGNRTLMASLEGWGFTIKLYPLS